MADDGFLALLDDLFRPLGGISRRRMFGGHGIFRDGVMVALVASDTLYFKADDETKGAFEAEGCEPFAYETRDGRRTIMSYWRAPERLYDEPDAFEAFARAAVEVGRRAQAAKAKSGRPIRRRGRAADAP